MTALPFFLMAPYGNDFNPLETARFITEGMPVSVERMRRLMLNLLDLKERRTPNMAITTYAANPLIWYGQSNTHVFGRYLLFQHEYVHQLVVVVHASYDASVAIWGM